MEAPCSHDIPQGWSSELAQPPAQVLPRPHDAASPSSELGWGPCLPITGLSVTPSAGLPAPRAPAALGTVAPSHTPPSSATLPSAGASIVGGALMILASPASLRGTLRSGIAPPQPWPDTQALGRTGRAAGQTDNSCRARTHRHAFLRWKLPGTRASSPSPRAPIPLSVFLSCPWRPPHCQHPGQGSRVRTRACGSGVRDTGGGGGGRAQAVRTTCRAKRLATESDAESGGRA